MISEPLILEGDLEIDHGQFYMRTPKGWRNLGEAFIQHFFPEKPAFADFVSDMPAPDVSPAEHTAYNQRFTQARAGHAGLMRILFEPQDGQGAPLRLEGECGIDTGELYVEGQVSGFVTMIFLDHFRAGPVDDKDEKDYQAELGAFRVTFEPTLSGK